VRSEVLTPMTTAMFVLLGCDSFETHMHIIAFHLLSPEDLKMETVCLSEMVVSAYEST
jgi:hypothetical protein